MPISLLEAEISDAGVQGARLATGDNNTTGRFTQQRFVLTETVAASGDQLETTLSALVSNGPSIVLADLTRDELKRVARVIQGKRVLLLNLSEPADELRGAECQANLLHIVPSYAMRADALAQFLVKKRWVRWLLLAGEGVGDRQIATAFKRAAKHFGARIVAEQAWRPSTDARRLPEAEVPLLTQGPDYDVVVVADESHRFGHLLPYRTWTPRLVVGTHGLTTVAWFPWHEAWGAVQLQKRFMAQAKRAMTELDYSAWLAVRAVGEAALRTKSLAFEALRDYLLSDKFSLAGFKGVPFSFRGWDRQLRQPILLAAEQQLIAVAPIEGFLHPGNELDTLGVDRPESPCRLQ